MLFNTHKKTSGKQDYPFPKQALVFKSLQYKSFENTVGQVEIARNEQFLLFPQFFSTLLDNFLPFSSNLKLSSANSLSLEQSKICRLGKGSLTILKTISCLFLTDFVNL